MSDIPTLQTERLQLVPFDERHFDDYAAMLADPDSTRFVGSGEPLDRMNAWRSMAMLLGHWALRGHGMWALERKADHAFIGRVGLLRPEGWPGVELGWMLMRQHRHHGYATEASQAALDFAWNELKLPRVISLIRKGDDPSLGLVQRLHGERVEETDFLGSPTSVFAYYPPAQGHERLAAHG